MDFLTDPTNLNFLKKGDPLINKDWSCGTFASSPFWENKGYYVQKKKFKCYNEVSNPMLHKDKDCGAPKELTAFVVKGRTLLLRSTVQNIAHFFSDQYYSFYTMASRPQEFNMVFDNICIQGKREAMHEYLALNLFPPELKHKIQLLEKGKLYLFEDVVLGTEDRLFHYRENKKTLIAEMRGNFYKNTSINFPNKNKKKKALIHQNRRGSSSYGRQILNLDELCNALVARNIEPHVIYSDKYWSSAAPEDLLKPFVDCDIFIGVWGAWLNNLIVSRPGSNIFSLRHPNLRGYWWTECKEYRHSACDYHNRELGNHFHEVPCEYLPVDYESKKVFKPPWNTLEYTANLFADIDFILERS